MKRYPKYVILAFALFAVAGCSLRKGNSPYRDTIFGVDVMLVYPKGFETCAHEGVTVHFEEVNQNFVYETQTDNGGMTTVSLPAGLYRISASDVQDTALFNGTSANLRILAKSSIQVPLTYSKRGSLVIKEIYCGGCQKLPLEGTYQADKYIIIHNNDVKTAYLDSLCFCTLYPFNAVQANPWGGIQNFAPIYMGVWQFPGDGTSHPLESGEDAVIALNGAIDHTVQYPLSVNLNRPEYYVCYNTVYFPNVSYHPAPGDQIQNDHILDAVCKLGIANAYSFSVNSPTAVIFRAKGCSIQEYSQRAGIIDQVPGSVNDKFLQIPWDWILDAVEVFTPSGACNKRLPDDMDSGYVVLTETTMGHSLLRIKDETMSETNGFEVLQDTNNSSVDFIQSEKATLWVEK